MSKGFVQVNFQFSTFNFQLKFTPIPNLTYAYLKLVVTSPTIPRHFQTYRILQFRLVVLS